MRGGAEDSVESEAVGEREEEVREAEGNLRPDFEHHGQGEG